MKKFTKGMLIAAGSLCAAGVVLGCVGVVGRIVTGEEAIDQREYNILQNTWGRFGKWRLRFVRGRERGIIVGYDNVTFDDDYDTVYGSFTDDSLQSEDVKRLDIEIGGGSLILRQGDHMELKKKGGPECQYYIKGDTFYLKQKCPVTGSAADLTLTLPKEINLDEVEIKMGAGEITAKDLLAAGEVEVTVDAGEITMEEVQTEKFSADVGAGSVTVKKLDAGDCDVDVDMGSVTLKDGLVTGNFNADVSMGEIEIYLRDSYEDHDYEVSCSMGEIEIADKGKTVHRYGGLANSMEFSGKNAAGDSEYNLNCSMGSIYVRFDG